MKSQSWLIVVMVILGTGGTLKAQRESQAPVVDIQRATIIAFYTPTSKADAADADTSEALSDFQFYAGRIKQPLSKLEIDFQELYVHSFRIHLGGKTIVFRPKTDVGYYLIAPGKKPHIEYGVMTDADLMLVAKRYFGSVTPHD